MQQPLRSRWPERHRPPVWNIFPPMRIGALVALLCVAACRTRSLARMAQQSDSVEFARLGPQDSTHGALLVPRVVAQPSVVLFWLRAADTMAAEDRADTFDDLKYYTEQIAPALDGGGINLLATNADTVYVELPNHTRRAVLLSGLDYPYGYLLIDPGGPERILTAVYADDDLLEELRVSFDLPDGTPTVRPPVATCSSPAAMCCCTTAHGGLRGRT